MSVKMTVVSGLFLSVFLGHAPAQVLTTAETLGRGSQAVMLSENHLFVDGVDLNIAYAQYVRGMSKRFDLYVSFGTTNIQGQNQE